MESSINTQALKPQTDLIKRRYGDDKDRIQRETSALYEKAGVNPLAGAQCGSRGGVAGRRGVGADWAADRICAGGFIPFTGISSLNAGAAAAAAVLLLPQLCLRG